MACGCGSPRATAKPAVSDIDALGGTPEERAQRGIKLLDKVMPGWARKVVLPASGGPRVIDAVAAGLTGKPFAGGGSSSFNALVAAAAEKRDVPVRKFPMPVDADETHGIYYGFWGDESITAPIWRKAIARRQYLVKLRKRQKQGKGKLEDQ